MGSEDPHINFVQIFHNSQAGVKTMQLKWPENPELKLVDTMKGSSTFTQAGNITPAHIDGFGLIQRMAHLGGDKVWIVWPPTEWNVRAVRDHHQALGPNRETRVDRWLEILKDPQVFLIRKGDSFFLGASVIHACVSLGPSAHYGEFCWKLQSLDVAKLNMGIFKEGYIQFVADRKQQMKNRQKENSKKLTSVEEGNRDTTRQYEDAYFEACKQFYQGVKGEWDDSDRKAWSAIQEELQSREVKKFLTETDKFMAKIK